MLTSHKASSNACCWSRSRASAALAAGTQMYPFVSSKPQRNTRASMASSTTRSRVFFASGTVAPCYLKPSTSCMSYRPGACVTTHCAARRAPRAKVSRLCTRCVTSIRSPSPPKRTVWSPMMSPARMTCMPISPLLRSPIIPLRPYAATASRAFPYGFGEHLRHLQRGPAGRVLLQVAMGFEHLDVVVLAQRAGDVGEYLQEDIDSHAHVGSDDARNRFGQLAEPGQLLGREPGRPDDHGFSGGGHDRQMHESGVRRGELNEDLGAVGQRGQIIGHRHAQTAAPRGFSGVGPDRGMPFPLHGPHQHTVRRLLDQTHQPRAHAPAGSRDDHFDHENPVFRESLNVIRDVEDSACDERLTYNA